MSERAPWRMKEPCAGCPFSDTEAGKRQWKVLTPAFKRQLRRDLLGRGGQEPTHFFCHKTAKHDDETGEFTPTTANLVCAGALAFQDKHGVSSNYVRVCETLDYYAAKRAERAGARPAKG